MKLQQRFNSLVIPLVVLPLIVLGWITYNRLFEESREGSFSNIDSVLVQLSQGLDQALDSVLANADLLASDLTVQQYALVDNDADRYRLYQQGLLNRFRVYMKAHPRYDEVRFILPDGYEDARWGRGDIVDKPVAASENWWIQPLLESGEAYFHYVGSNADTGREALHVFKPLWLSDVAGEGVAAPLVLRGYIGITLELDWLQREINALSRNADLHIALKSPHGQILMSSDGLPAAIKTELKQPLNRKSLTSNLDEGVVLEGTKYYLDSDGSPGDYVFVSAVSATQIHRAARDLSLDVVLLTLASILITIAVLSFFLRRTIVSPLRELIDVSNKLGAGKPAALISVEGGGELGELADSFNRMAQDLAHSDEKIRYIAHHDTLTKLPNRHLFQLYLDKSIASARRTNSELALLFLDIDNFKSINDTLGHDMGDELLRVFADRINHCLREEDFFGTTDTESTEELVARHGGDEFTIILPRLDGPLSAAMVAQRIIDSLEDEITLAGQSLRITTSIGVTMFPKDGDSIDALLKCADIAMYHAKDAGRNNYQFYTAEMMEKIVDRIESEKELRAAIEQGHMTLHYQPQIVGKNEEIYGFEALVRWEHSERGVISPFRFIHLAEETGLIVELGAWVLREACLQAAGWRAQGFPDFKISVNVSSVQFKKVDIAAFIAETLEQSGLPGENLTVELTESILISADGRTSEQLRKIQQLGVSIALDDFGTGYSSLSYLRTFPVDILKIDRSFIVESEKKAEVRAIVSAIVDMAAALDLKVIAEGAEELAHIGFLKAIDCDVIQGFFYSKPLPASQATAFLQNHGSPRGVSRSVA
jgi:diguanylate cyclase (GGDEF)-like protein